MLDHMSIAVSDIEKSRAFYDAALATLGYKRLREMEEADYAASGYGADEAEPPFWIGALLPAPKLDAPAAGEHIAFRAPSRAAVDAFHQAALDAGGGDNGPPGIRAHYHADYYAAFVIDPDGHHLEAVCHKPE